MKINDFYSAGKMYRRSGLFIRSLFKAKVHVQKLKPVRLQSTVHAVNLNVSPNRYSEELLNGLLRGDRASLASAITLVESRHPRKIQNAQWLLSQVLNEAKKKYEKFGDSSLSFRIGLTGPPGAGKSTFIETFGKLLTSKGHKVAVLTVDPSSSTSGGSLLGDKTRMPELSRDVNAYIRPSPTSGCLGGVTRSTNEAIAMCECAGYDTIIVETVGVGQSEIDVCRMVDIFVLIVPPAGGDELQALKKGVVELADVIAINKADGNFLPSARRIKAEFVSALKFIKQRHRLWKATVMLMSCLQKEGIEEVWNKMTDYRKIMLESGELQHRRKEQYVTWMWAHIENRLLSEFKNHNKIKDVVKDVESQVWEGSITPGQASDYLIDMFFGK